MADKTILEKILRWKRDEIVRHKRARPAEVVRAEMTLAPPPRDLVAALRGPGVSLIAEIKRASPSKGLLRHHFDAEFLARVYETNGAAAISVLTDQHFFQGNLEHLRAVRQNSQLPVLRKDFILDRYQIHEARAAGADAVLLIVAALGDNDLRDFYQLVRELDMAALVEVHNEAELERGLKIQPRVFGVNNRDLRTFNVNLETTARLRPLIPDDVVLVAESGVHTPADVARLAAIGADAMLVGEALVRAKDVGRKVRELVTGNE
jgi:indole-3-glycerol phosphate synthase